MTLVGCASGEAKPSDGTAAFEAWPSDLRGGFETGGSDLHPTTEAAAPDLWVVGDSVPLDTAPDQAPTPDLVPKPDTQPSVLTAPFSLDFEAGGGGLTATRDWEWGKIAFKKGPNCDSTPNPPTAGHSGMGMWGTKLNDCYSGLGNADYSCSNLKRSDDSVLTLKFKIPATFKTATLVYWEWTDFFLSWDWSEIYINGKVATQKCTGSTSAKWVKKGFILDTLVGQTVTVEFHFMASKVVQEAGWYIDDISVTESLPP